MELGFSLAHYVGAILAIVFGATVQASVGLGAGLIAVPILLLINPVFVPAPIILASLILTSQMAYRGRREFHPTEVIPDLIGIFIGAIFGVALVRVVDSKLLGFIFSIIILLAVVLSIKGNRIQKTRKNQVLIGTISGFMGSTTGIGAPPLALMYQDEPGNRLRALLAFLFFFGSLGMLAVMWLGGLWGMKHFVIGILLAPGMLIGYWISPRLSAFLDQGRIRTVVLGICSVSAVTLVIKNIIVFLNKS
ncbi:sulfite exporter TauE/SafE family protein [PVC group bacterium]|nr:sulfite exporter TauE/SafE family protein [PVC group bacterium]